MIVELIKNHPELFPPETENGFRMKDSRLSAKLSIVIRRIEINTSSRSIRPSFVTPYMTAFAKYAERVLLMRRFAVPFWAIARSHGRDPMYWFPMCQNIGKNSVLATTVREPKDLPVDLASDEKHMRLMGGKHYIATVVAKELVLSVNVSKSAGTDDLTEAYGVFQKEGIFKKVTELANLLALIQYPP